METEQISFKNMPADIAEKFRETAGFYGNPKELSVIGAAALLMFIEAGAGPQSIYVKKIRDREIEMGRSRAEEAHALIMRGLAEADRRAKAAKDVPKARS